MHFRSTQSWSSAWLNAWRKMLGNSERNCIHGRLVLGRLRGSGPGVLLDGSRWCLDRCLERAIVESLRRTCPSPQHRISHRIPLGLLLVSRQELTPEQLRAGLQEQRRSGHGKIGEWLEALGFISEQQVTAALARQWSCPVSKMQSVLPRSAPAPQVPIALLEKFSMIPIDYVAATKTLFIAFAEGIDYSVLYAIEQMMKCRTEACMAVPSFVQRNLQILAAQSNKSELLFEHIKDDAEFCRIVRSYCVRLGASEIRLAWCGPYRWIRLLRSPRSPLDLLISVSEKANLDFKDFSLSSTA